jgi:hypothetical protein
MNRVAAVSRCQRGKISRPPQTPGRGPPALGFAAGSIRRPQSCTRHVTRQLDAY